MAFELNGKMVAYCFLRRILTIPEDKEQYMEKWLKEYNKKYGHLEGIPIIISDQMNDTWHPATGKYTNSISEFRKMTKDSGCVEIGDENFTNKKQQSSREEIRNHIKTAISIHGKP